MLMREGFAFVHVSAQAAGICCMPLTPKVWDPVRYAALNHPGDAYAIDMFTQIAQAFRAAPPAARPDGRAAASQRVLAAGQSQSASRLYDYVDTTGQPSARRHRRLPDPRRRSRRSSPRRSPLPVLHLLSDAEATPASTQPPDPNYRLWEVAGDRALRLLDRLPVGVRPRAAGRRRAPRTTAGYDADHRRGRQLRRDRRTRCSRPAWSPARRCRCTTRPRPRSTSSTTGSAPATRRPTGRGSRSLAAAGQGRVRQHPRRDPAAADRRAGRARTSRPPASSAASPCRSPTSRCRRSTRRTPTTSPDARGHRRRGRRGWLLPPDAIDQMRRACTARERYPARSRGRCRGLTGLQALRISLTPPRGLTHRRR